MRYLPLTGSDRRAMLEAIGAPTVEALFHDVPEGARLDVPLDLPDHLGEAEVERQIEALAAKNLAASSAPFFLGAGSYRHHIPAAVDHLIQRGEFLTAYTPYQPEISQGTLQVLFEFQTQVALITGMDVANASMYDGASAAAEAVMMAHRSTRRRKAILPGGLHPHYREVCATTARHLDTEPILLPATPFERTDFEAMIDGDVACVVSQSPDLFGRIHDLRGLAETCHAAGALLIVVVTEPVSLGAIAAPGDMGADIVVAEGQSIGNAMGFGGPHLGLLAAHESLTRQLPGRLVGQTVDVDGRRGWVLTLATREQHIRREKATSNICTNSGLCALAFTIHLALLGEAGFSRLAALNHQAALGLAERLAAIDGIEILNTDFFNEFTLILPKPAAAVTEALAAKGILGGVPVSRFYPDDSDLANLLLVCATESNTESDMDALAAALGEVL